MYLEYNVYCTVYLKLNHQFINTFSFFTIFIICSSHDSADTFSNFDFFCLLVAFLHVVTMLLTDSSSSLWPTTLFIKQLCNISSTSSSFLFNSFVIFESSLSLVDGICTGHIHVVIKQHAMVMAVQVS